MADKAYKILCYKVGQSNFVLQTIINCFRKTGALPQGEETESEEDPFADIEEEDMSSLDELVCQINPDTSASDYIDADEDLSTCKFDF